MIRTFLQLVVLQRGSINRSYSLAAKYKYTTGTMIYIIIRFTEERRGKKKKGKQEVCLFVCLFVCLHRRDCLGMESNTTSMKKFMIFQHNNKVLIFGDHPPPSVFPVCT